MLHSTDGHPTLRVLVDLEDGVLDGRRLDAAVAHLETGCAGCARRRGRVRRIKDALSAGPLPPPPAALDRRVDGFLREAGFDGPLGTDALLASLVADSGRLAAVGVRSATGAARRLLYMAGDVEIDIEVVARPGGFDLLGQLLPPDAAADASARVEAQCGRMGVRTEAGPDGRFALRDLPAGGVRLTLRMDGRDILVRGLLLE